MFGYVSKQAHIKKNRAKLKLYNSVIRPIVTYSCETWIYPFKPRIKSHLLFAGIIRSSPFSPR